MKLITKVEDPSKTDGVKFIIESHGRNYEVLRYTESCTNKKVVYDYAGVRVLKSFDVYSYTKPFTTIVLAVQFAMFIESQEVR